ncbi:ATP-binding protein [Candidatus Woesearchaeota archaeon]|jgi:transitional endoplasmic reticulum ATPase|nr:ATP-binding protein [Candidatus Woesearchaeota archaeon]
MTNKDEDPNKKIPGEFYISSDEKDRIIDKFVSELLLQSEIIKKQRNAIDHYRKKLEEKEAGDPSIEIVVSQEETSYNDVGGLDDVLYKIKHFEYGMTHAGTYTHFGETPPKGLLMYGPPGCGKTMIAKAMSNELGCWFLEIPLSTIISEYVGKAEKNLNNALKMAKKTYEDSGTKVMVFVDEAEQMFRKKGRNVGHEVIDRCVNVWLRTMDGMGSNEGLIFVAATNYLESIEPALLRAGRFDYLIEIPKPTLAGVEDIFVKQMGVRERKAERQIYCVSEIENISGRMYDVGMTGADITEVLKRASLQCIRDCIENPIVKDIPTVTDSLLMKVINDYDRVQKQKRKFGFDVGNG